ncbi:MAG: metallophosphoesterase family protein [Nanoarchaeota archaeon]|nr:metallophosphoesterase family protein [Nanoarchaeota archaeon]
MMKILAIGDFHGDFPEKLKVLIKNEKPKLILSTGDYAGIKEWRPLLKKIFKARNNGKNLSALEILGTKKYNLLLKKDFNDGKKVIENLNKLKIKTFSVFGNGDWYEPIPNDSKRNYAKLIKKLNYIKNINRGHGSFEKLKITGFGGYLDPDAYFTKIGIKAINEDKETNKERKIGYDYEEEKLMNLIKNKPEILLIHYTPYGCLDRLKEKDSPLNGKNLGVSSYNRAIEKFKPVLVICGHMHENQGSCNIGKTIIVNPGSASEGKAAIIEFDEKEKKIKGVKFIK